MQLHVLLVFHCRSSPPRTNQLFHHQALKGKKPRRQTGLQSAQTRISSVRPPLVGFMSGIQLHLRFRHKVTGSPFFYKLNNTSMTHGRGMSPRQPSQYMYKLVQLCRPDNEPWLLAPFSDAKPEPPRSLPFAQAANSLL